MQNDKIYYRAALIFTLTLIVYAVLSHLPTSKSIEHKSKAVKSSSAYSPKMTNKEVRENLGRSTWTLLHTIAATYPAFPTAQHKKDVLKFIYLISKIYPCGECAEHFQKLLSGLPPRANSHDDLKLWLCEAHNKVNKRLGKSQFECIKIDDYWKCGCKKE